MFVAHDYYFKPDGVKPGDDEIFDFVDPTVAGHVLWVRYVDGEEWGDHDMGQAKVLIHRQTIAKIISDMVNAYAHGGDKECSAYLQSNAEPDNLGWISRMKTVQKQSGTEGAIGYLKVRLESATKHAKMLSGK